MGCKSQEIFQQAKEIFPGGVNSPVRAFANVGCDPFIVAAGQGAELIDVDGQKYIDYVLSWGPLVLGHAHPEIVAAITEQAQLGTSYGACCELETMLALEIKKHYSSLELMRFVNSGTEAGMAVVRLARAFTKRSKIIKFAGCYHGHLDALLVQAGSGATTFAVPSSGGVPESVVKDTLIAEYNNLDSVQELFEKNPDAIAAILVEPAAGNMGFIPPCPGFLQGLRELCNKNQALLIFDEVMTGFRTALGGMQQLAGIQPDLTMLGKVIGGGLPVGAFGGRRDVMQLLAPLGPVYQAGTLSGNPLAMMAGLRTLQLWEQQFDSTAEQAQKLAQAFIRISEHNSIPLQAASVGTMFGFFFADEQVNNYREALKCDLKRYAKFFKLALAAGIYFAPAQFEAGFLSSAHNEKILDKTISSLESVFYDLKNAS